MSKFDYTIVLENNHRVGVFPTDRPELTLMVNDRIKNRNCAFVPSGDVGWVKAVSVRPVGPVFEIYVTVIFLANPKIDSLVKFDEIDEASILKAHRQRIAA